MSKREFHRPYEFGGAVSAGAFDYLSLTGHFGDIVPGDISSRNSRLEPNGACFDLPCPHKTTSIPDHDIGTIWPSKSVRGTSDDVPRLLPPKTAPERLGLVFLEDAAANL